MFRISRDSNRFSTNRERSTFTPVLVNVVNIICQLLLWGGLITDVLVHHHHGSSLWAVFSLGFVMVIVGSVLQFKTARKQNTWLNWLAFGVVILSGVGNIAGLIAMGVAGVPYEVYDTQVILVALAASVVLAGVPHRFPLFATIGEAHRVSIIVSVCTRGGAQIAAGLIAMGRGLEPAGILPLVAIAVISLTFLLNAKRQHEAHPTPDTKASLYMFGLNFVGAMVMAAAFLLVKFLL